MAEYMWLTGKDRKSASLGWQLFGARNDPLAYLEVRVVAPGIPFYTINIQSPTVSEYLSRIDLEWLNKYRHKNVQQETGRFKRFAGLTSEEIGRLLSLIAADDEEMRHREEERLLEKFDALRSSSTYSDWFNNEKKFSGKIQHNVQIFEEPFEAFVTRIMNRGQTSRP